MHSALRIVLFSLLRLAVFLVPLGVFLWLGMQWIFAAVYAALIGAALSLLVLGRFRDPISEAIVSARASGERSKPIVDDADSVAEDAAADAAAASESTDPTRD